MQWVNPYERADGTPVRGYWRSAPGARRGTTLVAIAAVLVVGWALGRSADGTARGPAEGGGTSVPKPVPSAVYPVKWPDQQEKSKEKPRSRQGVTYPIPWATGTAW